MHKKGGYTVGYFECWSAESFFAVWDAAGNSKSPVIMGFSGIYLPNKKRVARDNLKVYADMARQVCKDIRVLACTIFNESPYYKKVIEAISYGYSMVMFSNLSIDFKEQMQRVAKIVKSAHEKQVFVEGEVISTPGVGGEIEKVGTNLNLTNPEEAQIFVSRTQIDALTVNIGHHACMAKEKCHLILTC